MRIVNRAEFLKMPAGTIYCKGMPWVFDGICIKDESLSNDWYYLNPAWVSAHDSGEAFERLDEMLKLGKSYPMENAIGRDGLFDTNAIFLIFERSDLEMLRGFINRAIAKSMLGNDDDRS